MDDKSKLEYEGGGEEGDQAEQEEQLQSDKAERKPDKDNDDMAHSEEEEQINENTDDKYEDRQFAQPKVGDAAGPSPFPPLPNM